MKKLVLGHGKSYVPKEIRCSSLPVEEWCTQPYTSVDMDEEVKPDILYDLRKYPWAFAEDSSYDRVIDTCGLAFYQKGSYSSRFLEQVMQILTPGGRFYGFRSILVKKPLEG
jgi:hypothetical protein